MPHQVFALLQERLTLTESISNHNNLTLLLCILNSDRSFLRFESVPFGLRVVRFVLIMMSDPGAVFAS